MFFFCPSLLLCLHPINLTMSISIDASDRTGEIVGTKLLLLVVETFFFFGFQNKSFDTPMSYCWPFETPPFATRPSSAASHSALACLKYASHPLAGNSLTSPLLSSSSYSASETQLHAGKNPQSWEPTDKHFAYKVKVGPYGPPSTPGQKWMIRNANSPAADAW